MDSVMSIQVIIVVPAPITGAVVAPAGISSIVVLLVLALQVLTQGVMDCGWQ